MQFGNNGEGAEPSAGGQFGECLEGQAPLMLACTEPGPAIHTGRNLLSAPSPDSEVLSSLHNSLSPTLTHFSILKSAQIAQR